MISKLYLGLGSNLGNRKKNLACAIRLIGERVGKVLRVSSFVETEPWGFESKNNFLNVVICCETELTPRQVLQTTQQIERDLGKRKCHATRRQKEINYQDRPIDIDILLYDDLIVDEPDLKIPHPLMNQRLITFRTCSQDLCRSRGSCGCRSLCQYRACPYSWSVSCCSRCKGSRSNSRSDGPSQ